MIRLAERLVVASLVLISACAVSQRDYSAYRQHMPRSILVLPPLNESTDVNAPYVYLSTISRPLAECGYYVFPVAVVDAYLKENGLPTPGEMHAIPLQKIKEVIGADAVLDVTIEDWGQKYLILTSNTVVKARAQLVDVASGTTLWNGTAFASEGSGGGQDPIGMAVAALVGQIIGTMTDQAHGVSHQANNRMVFDQQNGFLIGHYHPGYEADSRGR